MTKEPELLPCPFCGSAAELLQETNLRTGEKTDEWTVHCRPCDNCPDRCWSKPKAEAIAAWNQRIPDPTLLARIEALEGALRGVDKVVDGYKSQMKFCDIEALSYFREFVRRIEDATKSARALINRPSQ